MKALDIYSILILTTWQSGVSLNLGEEPFEPNKGANWISSIGSD